MRYVIAKYGVESLLTTKETWDKYPDDFLNVVLEFDAESIDEAEAIYDKEINGFSYKKA